MLPCIVTVTVVLSLCMTALGSNTYVSHDLLLENIDALASGDTSPEINCDASKNRKCQFYCGGCKKNLKGTGATTGTHSCGK